MFRIMLKSKIHRAKVTATKLYYEGSIAIDTVLLVAADILPGEKVEVLNLNNGARLETYAIQGKKGSGEICLNGPSARFACEGDEVIILAYGLVSEEDAPRTKKKIIHVDSSNKITNKILR
jgi:aspartate 1-decarboxylase